MLIPIGHESTNLRSPPYATFTMLGIFILVFAFQSVTFTSNKEYEEYQLLDELLGIRYQAGDELKLPPDVARYLELVAPKDEIDKMIREYQEEVFGADNLESKEAPPAKEEFDYYGTKEHEEAQGYRYEDEYDGYWRPSSSRGSPFSFQGEGQSLEEMQARADEISKRLGEISEILWVWNWGYVPKDNNLIGLIGYNFLHGGFWHLFGNVLFLYLFGCLIEDRYGRTFFTAFTLLGGIFAGFAYGLHYPQSHIVLIGASGMVFVVLGGYLVKHYRDKIRFLFIFGFRGRVFDAPAWVALPLILLKEFAMAYVSDSIDPSGSGGGVAHWVHIWGFVFGAGTIFALSKSGLEDKFWPPLIDLDSPEESDNLRHALKEERLGNLDSALNLMRKGSRDDPHDIDMLQNYWRLARTLNRGQDMLISGQKLMALDLEEQHPKMAHVRFKELLEVDPSARLSPSLINKLARALAAERYYMEAEEMLKHGFNNMANPSPKLLMPMVEICAEMQIPLGIRIAQVLRESEGFTEHAELNALVQKIKQGLSQGSPAQDDSISIASGGESLALADAHEFQELEAAPKNVHALKVFPAKPLKLSRENITLEVAGKEKEVPFNQIKMIAVGVLREQGSKPKLLIDLIFDRPRDVLPQHRVLRLSSDQFNPLALLPRMKNPGEALKRLIAGMLKASGADPAPSKDAATGAPYTNYPNLRSFERDIYYGS